MTDLDAAIRARLVLHDSGEATVLDMRCAYDCETTQAALLAVLDLHHPDDCGDCSACTRWEDDMVAHAMEYPCPTLRAIAEKLGVEAPRA